MLFKDNEKILFTGDSVTDAGRARPVGMNAGLGNAYVAVVNNMLNAFYPELRLPVYNTGVSGNTSRDLAARFDSDVLALEPDTAVICIGFNDVWRQYDYPAYRETHVYIDEYERNLEEMVGKALKAGIRVILMTPYYIDPNREDWMRKSMDRYGAAVKKIAERHGLMCIDLQKPFDEFLKYRYSASVVWDRVHPNNIGSMLIAREFLKAVGFDRFN